MNGFFAVLSRRDEPIARNVLAEMAHAIEVYRRDGVDFWQSGVVAIGAVVQWGTPESRFEAQPAVGAEGRFVLGAEARLDNRSDLIKRLGVKPTSEQPVTDAHIILAAYERWGESCARELVGDYAFALWDEPAQRLFCCRDAMGPIPLYYFADERWIVVSNFLRAMVAHPAVSGALNDDAVALHLRWLPSISQTQTFLAGVQKLHQGHSLWADRSGIRTLPYWQWEDVSEVRLSRPADYAEGLFSVIDQAVQDRLRTLHQVGAHASGGLDSTTVAGLALRHLREQGKSIAAYNYIPTPRPEDDTNSAEIEGMRSAARYLGMAVENIDLTAESVAQILNTNFALDGYTDLWYEPLLRARAQPKGIGLILSGFGGDEVASSGTAGYWAEQLARGNLVGIGQYLLRRTRGTGLSRPRRMAGAFLRQSVMPFVPDPIFERWFMARAGSLIEEVTPAPAFRPQVEAATYKPFRIQRTLHATQAYKVAEGMHAGRLEAWALQGARDGMRYAYPLLDRRVVAYCLGVPSHIFVGDFRQSRSLFRAAIQGHVPDEIRLLNAKLESLRVARYLEYTAQGCRLWLHAWQANDWGGVDERQAMSRYIDVEAFATRALRCDAATSVSSTLADGTLARVQAAADETSSDIRHLTGWGIGATIAAFRQIQVMVSAAGLDLRDWSRSF